MKLLVTSCAIAVTAILAPSVIAPSAIAASTSTPVKVCVAYDVGGVDDQSFNAAVAAGVKDVIKKYSIKVETTLTTGTESNRTERLHQLLGRGCSPIIAVGPGYAAALSKVAAENPLTAFAIVDNASVPYLNVSSIVFADNQIAYVAGSAAALITTKHKVGLITSVADAPIFESAFAAGAKASDKGVVTITRKGSQLGKSAQELIDAGADVLFSSLEGSEAEIFAAVLKANRAGKMVSLITMEPDQFLTIRATNKKYIAASIVKRVDKAVLNLVSTFMSNESFNDVLDAKSGIYGYRFGIADKAIEISLFDPKLVALTKKVDLAAQVAANLPSLNR